MILGVLLLGLLMCCITFISLYIEQSLNPQELDQAIGFSCNGFLNMIYKRVSIRKTSLLFSFFVLFLAVMMAILGNTGHFE